MKKIVKILPHINIAISGMFIILWIIDLLNPTMNLINRNSSNKILILLFVITIIDCALTIYYQRKANTVNTNKQNERQVF